MCQNGDNDGFCANNNGHGPAAISIYLKFLIQVCFLISTFHLYQITPV